MPLSEILVAANVLPQHVDHLVTEGWTAEHFGLCATSIEELDNVMAEILEGPLTHLNKAALRLAWTRCQPGKRLQWQIHQARRGRKSQRAVSHLDPGQRHLRLSSMR